MFRDLDTKSCVCGLSDKSVVLEGDTEGPLTQSNDVFCLWEREQGKRAERKRVRLPSRRNCVPGTEMGGLGVSSYTHTSFTAV